MRTGVIYYTTLVMGISWLLVVGWASDEILGQISPSSEPSSKNLREQSLKITMESYSYTPSEIMLKVGKVVKITLYNDSFLVPHNFLLDDPNGVRLIEVDVGSGEERVVEFTPAIPGTYSFYCDKQLLFFPNHREEGMEGRFLVR